MATLTKGYTFGATESVTSSKLHSLVDNGSISGIVNADVNASAGITENKLTADGSLFCALSGTQTVAGTKTFSGDCTFSGALDLTSATITGQFTAGMIMIWSGAVSAIPTGWVICDGTNSTPDLTDRFVIHADADSGGTNNVGDTGGENTHTLTIDEIPAHTHQYTHATMSDGNGSASGVVNLGTNYQTGSTGGGSAHENRPKFYALAYIMKT